jgi:hypothetical protein
LKVKLRPQVPTQLSKLVFEKYPQASGTDTKHVQIASPELFIIAVQTT